MKTLIFILAVCAVIGLGPQVRRHLKDQEVRADIAAEVEKQQKTLPRLIDATTLLQKVTLEEDKVMLFELTTTQVELQKWQSTIGKSLNQYSTTEMNKRPEIRQLFIHGLKKRYIFRDSSEVVILDHTVDADELGISRPIGSE